MNRRRRLIVQLVLTAAFLAAAGATAVGATAAAPKVRWVHAPWKEIARGRTGRLLVIDVVESTRDKHSPCFNHYKTRVVKQSARAIEILLLKRVPHRPKHFACPALAIRGPFLVPVNLKAPYRGQALIDASTGLRHKLVPRSALF